LYRFRYMRRLYVCVALKVGYCAGHKQQPGIGTGAELKPFISALKQSFGCAVYIAEILCLR